MLHFPAILSGWNPTHKNLQCLFILSICPTAVHRTRCAPRFYYSVKRWLLFIIFVSVTASHGYYVLISDQEESILNLMANVTTPLTYVFVLQKFNVQKNNGLWRQYLLLILSATILLNIYCAFTFSYCGLHLLYLWCFVYSLLHVKK